MILVALAGCIGGGSSTGTDDVINDTDEPLNASEIKNQTNTTVKIPDEETDAYNPNSSIHTHDYWQGGNTVTIVENAQVPGFTEDEVVTTCVREISCPPRGARRFNLPIPEEDDTPKYIYPGTGRITVDLTWTGGTGNIAPVMCVVNNGRDPFAQGCANYNAGQTNLNGSFVFESKSDVWTIEGDDLNKRTWDVPHTMKSKWRFGILADRCAIGTLSQYCMPATDIDEFQITIKIHRNDENLPVDPPHLDYYRGRDQVTVLPQTTLSGDETGVWGTCEEDPHQGTTSDWYRREVWGDRVPLCEFGGFLIRSKYAAGDADAPVIPPGTKTVKLTLNWESSNPSQLPVELELRYRDAMDNWGSSWQVPQQSDCSGGSCTYTIPIQDTDEADSLYAFRSVWEFGVFNSADHPAPADGLTASASVVAMSGTGTGTNSTGGGS